MNSFKTSLVLVYLTLSLASLRRSDVIHFDKDGAAGESNSQFDVDPSFISSDSTNLPHHFPSNGDMRLVTSSSDDGGTIVVGGASGRLEVYIHSMYCSDMPPYLLGNGEENEGRWGTICGHGFSMKEAHVACRQLGYRGALKWNYSAHTEFGVANESTPVILSGVKCPKSDHLHLLRCDHEDQLTSSGGCNHTSDVAVYCDSVRIWDNPYRGQVRLVSDHEVAHSYGRVEVFHADQWGTVCQENFNEAAAVSICRQLGYTGAVAVSNANPGDGMVWTSEASCESFEPCFTFCFTRHQWTHDCNHTQDVAVQCAFDENTASEMTSGCEAQCKITSFPLALVIVCVTLAVLAITLVGSGIIAFFLITRCCKKRCSLKKVHYEQLS